MRLDIIYVHLLVIPSGVDKLFDLHSLVPKFSPLEPPGNEAIIFKLHLISAIYLG